MSKKTLFIIIGVALAFAISLFVIARANKERVIEVDPGFAKYISGYSSGAQSRTAPLPTKQKPKMQTRIHLGETWHDR